MNIICGDKGPYFHGPCQRDRFPSLLDELGENGDKLVAHLGISNMPEMGARLKKGTKHLYHHEQRAAEHMKSVGGPMLPMFQPKSEALRRGVDMFTQMPVFDVSEYGRNSQHERCNIGQRPNRPVRAPAPRQAGEPPYTGNCEHCRRTGSNDVTNDCQGRMLLRQASVFRQIDNLHLGDELDDDDDDVDDDGQPGRFHNAHIIL